MELYQLEVQLHSKIDFVEKSFIPTRMTLLTSHTFLSDDHSLY